MTTQTQTTQQDRKRHPDRHTYPDKDAHIRVSHILHHKRQQMLCQILNTTQHQLTGSSLQRFLLLHINNNHNNKAQNGFGRSHIWDMLIPVSNVEFCSRQVAANECKIVSHTQLKVRNCAFEVQMHGTVCQTMPKKLSTFKSFHLKTKNTCSRFPTVKQLTSTAEACFNVVRRPCSESHHFSALNKSSFCYYYISNLFWRPILRTTLMSRHHIMTNNNRMTAQHQYQACCQYNCSVNANAAAF